MQRRIAVHVLLLSALSQFIVSCPGQYLGDGFGSDGASGLAGTGVSLDTSHAPVMSLGGGDVAEGLGPKRDYDSGIGMPISSTHGTYPLLVGRYGIGQGLGYGSEVGPSYGRYGIGPGLGYGSEVGPFYGRYGIGQGFGYGSDMGSSYGRYGIGSGLGYGSEVGPFYGRYGIGPGFGYGSEVGPSYARYGIGLGLGYGSEVGPSYGYGSGIAPGRDYAGGMDQGFGYGGGIGAPAASAVGMDSNNGAIGSKYQPSLGYGGPLGVANTGSLTSYPIGGLSYAPVYPSTMVGSAVPSPQQRTVLNANENTNTNVNVNNNMGKHRARLIGRGLLGTPQT